MKIAVLLSAVVLFYGLAPELAVATSDRREVVVGQGQMAKTSAEVKAVAKAVTVEIKPTNVNTVEVGSGVIIHRQGNLYMLVTNKHVVVGKCGQSICNAVPKAASYSLGFGNGKRLKVPAAAVKLVGKDLDLAVIQFRSKQRLTVAQVAEPGSLRVGNKVYTSGYPLEQSGLFFNDGEAIAIVNKRLTGDKGGYTVIYNAETQPGMSGGGVFDASGCLVAIHGQGDRYRDKTQVDDGNAKQEVGSKIGINRGIPVRWVVQGLAASKVRLGGRKPVDEPVTTNAGMADEFFITGFNRSVEPGADVLLGKQEAIQSFSKAIQRNPNYAMAYFMRAHTYGEVQNYPLAVADYNKVITLNPSFALAYNNRGNLKTQNLNDPQGALADYNKAISLWERSANALNSKLAGAYGNRGLLKADKLNDPQGALADYNKSIALNPNYYNYYNRGLLKHGKLNDPQGALADYNRSIALNPNFTSAYIGRGFLKYGNLNDPQGALADYNKAIFLWERSANALNLNPN